MDPLTFVATIIGLLAWPTAVIIILIVIRRSVAQKPPP
jgi:hypothetical protein